MIKSTTLKLILLIVILAVQTSSFAQDKKFECNCAVIGLDSLWANSNKITCYQVPVQRNVLDKSSTRIFKLAVAVAPALATTGQSPLLYLHGGPGIATLENLPRYLTSKTWKQIRQNRPLVFFDYRGTGVSEPSLCPDMQDSLAALAARDMPSDEKQAYTIELYRQCRMQLLSKGIDVSVFNSFQLSEDAEAIRKALEIDNWNVYGVSFGTTVALNLLRNHGKHINGMILDSPFPPNAPWVDFVRPFETSFKILEEKLAGDKTAASYFPSIRNDFVKAVTRLNKTPAKIKMNDSIPGFDFSGDNFAWSVWSALLKPNAIPVVPLMIHEVAKGNDSILSNWVKAFSDQNAYGKFSDLQSKAILCYEGKPKTVADTKAALQVTYPEFTSFNIDFDGALCDAWQPTSAVKNAFDPVVSDVPVLILSGEYDPVCPPLFGEITAKTLSNSTFINVPAASHAAIHVDDCLRNIAFDFLSEPTKKLSVDCTKNRPEIIFVNNNLEEALLNLNKK